MWVAFLLKGKIWSVKEKGRRGGGSGEKGPWCLAGKPWLRRLSRGGSSATPQPGLRSRQPYPMSSAFFPSPPPLPPRLAFLSAETLLPFPNPLTTSSPAPPVKGGRTLHPNLVLEQGKRGPNLALKRAELAPLSPSREGRGANPFRT